MSADTKQPAPSSVSEPRTLARPVPVWLFVLLFLLLYWGMVYFDTQGGWEPIVYKPYHSVDEIALYQPLPGEGPNLPEGEKKFRVTCGICHGDDGSGKPAQAPPLAGSEWVVGPHTRLIRIPQLGLSGPINVKGQEMIFPSGMAAMGASLTDEDLANVLSYIRQAWGNKADPITPEQVKTVRALVSGQSATTAKALLNLPEK